MVIPSDVLTAGALRDLLRDVPDGEPVMVCIDGYSATWARRAEHDPGGRTVDVSGGHLIDMEPADAWLFGPPAPMSAEPYTYRRTTPLHPLSDYFKQLEFQRHREFHTPTAGWACYRTASGRQVHVRPGCRCDA